MLSHRLAISGIVLLVAAAIIGAAVIPRAPPGATEGAVPAIQGPATAECRTNSGVRAAIQSVTICDFINNKYEPDLSWELQGVLDRDRDFFHVWHLSKSGVNFGIQHRGEVVGHEP